MKTHIPSHDAHQDMREALRGMFASFDSAYWQQVDHARGYPEEFVNALTEAGWLAALIPAEYGGCLACQADQSEAPDRRPGGWGRTDQGPV